MIPTHSCAARCARAVGAGQHFLALVGVADAAEAGVGLAAIDGALAAAAGPVAATVLVAAQERAAALHALGDARLARVVAGVGPARVALGAELVVPRLVPVG